jgi:cytochrome b561
MPTPPGVSVGINLGITAAMLFVIADLHNFIKIFNLIISSKKEWEFLQTMRERWHYIHYFGSIAAFVLIVIHVFLLGGFGSFLHWILLAFTAVMVVTGLTMRFVKVPPQLKQKLYQFHAHLYMFIIFLALDIVSHLISLKWFPY